MDKKRVLILCTGNSCRSQMAEALVNAQLGDHWQAFSAGTKPAERFNPNADTVLREIGIEHHGVPKSMTTFYGQPFDIVITVCDDAKETCPVWVGQGERVHIGFIDPVDATGTPDEILAVYRTVRDQIADQLVAFLHERG
jgi:arsenate reductase (thioredoxin)